MNMLDSALSYISEGFKVFPVRPDKKPFTDHGFKDATQLQVTVKELWAKFPEAGIGMPTDRLIVLDFDKKNGGNASKKAIEEKYGKLPATRTHRTGGGGLHYLYSNPNGTDVRNAAAFGGYSGLDIRANGGYIVMPPSPHESGKCYEVIDKSPIAPVPDWVMEIIKTKAIPTVSATPGEGQPIPEGQRDATLTSLAGTMRRKGMTEAEILAAIQVTNQTRCNPPMPDKDIQRIAKSVSRYQPGEVMAGTPPNNPPGTLPSPGYGGKGVRGKGGLGDYAQIVTESVTKSLQNEQIVTENTVSLQSVTKLTPPESNRYTSLQNIDVGHKADAIRDFILETEGSWFSYADLDREMFINSPEDKVLRRVCINRLLERGIIEKHPQLVHTFRYVNKDTSELHIKPSSEVKPVKLWLPFGLNQLVNIYTGNIIMIVGDPNAGKTALLLAIAKMNRDLQKVNYFSSEMFDDELSIRTGNHEDMTIDEWNKIKFRARANLFSHVVVPNEMNMIDYMEINENVYMVGQWIADIHVKHEQGVTFIGLQKKRGADLGRGQEFSLEKPRLYLSLSPGKCKIIKAKNWKHKDINPNDLECTYKLIGGAKIVDVSKWYDTDGRFIDLPAGDGDEPSIAKF